MTDLWRDALMSNLTNHEMVEAVIMEFRRRGLVGCIFLVPNGGGSSVFASASPENSISDLSASEQLQVFSDLAATAVTETPRRLEDFRLDETRKPN